MRESKSRRERRRKGGRVRKNLEWEVREGIRSEKHTFLENGTQILSLFLGSTSMNYFLFILLQNI